MKKFMALAALLMLGACGTVGNAVISDASLQEKAAFALNTTPNKVKISNRRATMDSIKFVATKGGKSYQCHYHCGRCAFLRCTLLWRRLGQSHRRQRQLQCPAQSCRPLLILTIADKQTGSRVHTPLPICFSGSLKFYS